MSAFPGLSGGFVFKPTFNLATPAPAKEPEPEDDGDAGAEEEHHEPEGTPQLHSGAKAETLEEDEDVLFKQRAKLFRFDHEGKQWKERGTGDVKLLKHRTTGKIRLLMRREKTYKVCANHYALQLRENVSSDRSWIWAAMDFSEESAKQDTFAIRFATSDQAKGFKSRFEECQKEMGLVLAGKPVENPLKPIVEEKKEDEKKEEKKEEKKDEKKEEKPAETKVEVKAETKTG